MRTAIMFGALVVADAISNSAVLYTGATMKFVAGFILVCMCMDIVDLFRNKK